MQMVFGNKQKVCILAWFKSSLFNYNLLTSIFLDVILYSNFCYLSQCMSAIIDMQLKKQK